MDEPSSDDEDKRSKLDFGGTLRFQGQEKERDDSTGLS